MDSLKREVERRKKLPFLLCFLSASAAVVRRHDFVFCAVVTEVEEVEVVVGRAVDSYSGIHQTVEAAAD